MIKSVLTTENMNRYWSFWHKMLTYYDTHTKQTTL